ncbi:MAG: EI24 domain-containing protein [Cytophagales bacterium]|nr:EI24 domain-containing protein [Cytophagales bacterium]
MSFLKEFFLGITTYFDAISFINQHKLWKFLILPALINIVLFITACYLGWIYAGELTDFIAEKMGVNQIDEGIRRIIQIIILIIIRFITFLIYFKFYRYLVLIIMAPVLAFISEKTQEIISGTTVPFVFSRFIGDVLRGMGIALKNLGKELTLTILIYLLLFIPFLLPLVPIFIIIIESYFYGFAMIDYRNEFKRLSAKESSIMIWEHKGFALGNGLSFNILLFVPIIGVLFAPVFAVIAAGIGSNKIGT